jgi:hypothetical protein
MCCCRRAYLGPGLPVPCLLGGSRPCLRCYFLSPGIAIASYFFYRARRRLFPGLRLRYCSAQPHKMPSLAQFALPGLSFGLAKKNAPAAWPGIRSGEFRHGVCGPVVVGPTLDATNRTMLCRPRALKPPYASPRDRLPSQRALRVPGCLGLLRLFGYPAGPIFLRMHPQGVRGAPPDEAFDSDFGRPAIFFAPMRYARL